MTIGQVLTEAVGHVVQEYADLKACSFPAAARQLATTADDSEVAALLNALAVEYDTEARKAAELN